MMARIWAAADFLSHFFGMLFPFLLGQSRLRCPKFLHRKHFPSFINLVLSSVDIWSTSIAFGSLFCGNANRLGGLVLPPALLVVGFSSFFLNKRCARLY